MLRSNDVSNDAKLNNHATVTDVTQKARGCRYINCLSCLCDGDDFIGMVKHINEKDKIIFFKL